MVRWSRCVKLLLMKRIFQQSAHLALSKHWARIIGRTNWFPLNHPGIVRHIQRSNHPGAVRHIQRSNHPGADAPPLLIQGGELVNTDFGWLWPPRLFRRLYFNVYANCVFQLSTGRFTPNTGWIWTARQNGDGGKTLWNEKAVIGNGGRTCLLYTSRCV